MKNKLQHIILIVLVLYSLPKATFAQVPSLGSAADYVLFTSVGAITSTPVCHITGNVGSNSGAGTGFGNVNGQMHSGDGSTAAASAALLSAYNILNATAPTFFLAPLLGNGQLLIPGVYSITSPVITLNLDLTLDGQSDPNSVFIFELQGAFSTNANAKVHLINGALACNVFWKVEGAVGMAAGTSMKGNIIANNGAITMNVNDTLEGRALSTTGLISVDGVLAYTPVGCGSQHLTGPAAPNLVSAECYTLFSSNGPVTDLGAVSHVVGDIGTNLGLTTGYNPLFVQGAIHPIPDGSTVAAAADLLNAYSYLNTLPADIELLYPAQFGHNLVLTPHTYIMNAAVTFTDSLFLDAMGDANAVFIIKTYGAFSTSTFSKVILINGARAKNVYWLVSGAVSIMDFSIFNGTIVCNNGAMDLTTGVIINGRALTTNGALSTAAITAIMPPGCPGFTEPIISTEPINQTVCMGDSVSFWVVSTGTNLTYQWRKGNVNLVNGVNISGVHNDTLTINPASITDVANNYNVIVSGLYTPNDTSINASLILSSGVVITSQPTNQTVCEGSTVSFDVAATGTGLTYQWRKGIVNLINGVAISGVTTATLTINPTSATDAGNNYNVVVSGGCLPNATSNNVSLILNTAPTITLQPTNQTVCEGSTVSFDVAATGTNLTYQWRKGIVNLTNGVAITGITTATLTINPTSATDAGNNYNVVVIGGCLPNATSNNVSLILNTATTITLQPTNQTVCEGSTVSFDVAATGTNLTYQWRKGIVNLTNNVSTTGVTTATLTINPTSATDAGNNYNVVASGGCLPNATSNNVSLVFSTAPTITLQPTSQTVCEGSSVSFDVAATGTGLTYQWRKGIVNLINGVAITGVTTATLTINPTTVTDAANNYNVVVSGGCLPNVTSNNVSLVFSTAPTITLQPTSQTVCEGSTVSFDVAATGTGLNYQWRKGIVNLINGVAITGVTTATLTINPTSATDAGNNYNVVVSGGCLPNSTSNNVSLILNTAPTITLQPTNQTVCEGSTVSFDVAATGTGLTYQWRKGIVNLINGVAITGVTTATLTINPTIATDAGNNYNVVISGGCLPNVTSNNVSLAINALPIVTANTTSNTVCVGTLVTLTGGGATSYVWTGGVIDGISFIPPSTNTYTVTGTDGNGCSNTATTGVAIGSSLSILVNSPTICSGQTAGLIANGGTTYTWSAGATQTGVNTADATLSTTTSFTVTGTTGTCIGTAVSTVNVNSLPTVTANATSNTVCTGASVTLTGGGATSYLWTGGVTDGISFIPASTNTYTVTGTDGNNCSNSATTNVNVNALPIVIANATSNTVCAGASVTLIGGGATTYIWTNGVTNGISFIPALTNTYTVTGTNGNNCSNIATTNVNVNPLPIVTANATSNTVCAGTSVTLTGVGATSYLWTGGVTNGISFIPASTNTYTVTGTNANNCSNTATTIVNVNLIPVAIASSNSPICFGSQIILIAQTVLGATYSWTGPNTYSSTSQNPIIGSATTNDAGVYSLIVNNSCASASSTVAVVVNTCSVMDFYIPEGFSPNGDGINDVFFIRGIDNYPKNTFVIYNRWGNKVFEANNYQNTWSGTATTGMRMGGDELPTGTYFYVLDLGNGSDVYKGTITLNR